ncbi:MAG: ABC transporter permease [Blastocatellia bacterium]|nr:ABC transporter permease [Blastocatellia bacterium]MCS7157439.1 ABC transporter permease [Blastocatellia bacterium]MCX7752612.1 ABC transporter permease [Blastocatellia bacterium]MDW8168343.1 ABC transporter permease [Acidobacteriota bacterium]MDW8255539.1 ABC transporter permease [Acidobacteriota bacterium]
MRETGANRWLLLAPSILWLLLFFLLPLGLIVVMSFAERGLYGGVRWTFGLWNYRQAMDPLYLWVYGRSFALAAVTTALCLVISYPVAYYIALRADPKWKNLLLVLSILPFWTSFLLRTYAWMFLLRVEGFVNTTLLALGVIERPMSGLLYSDFAVVIGQVYGELPFMILPLYVALERVDVRLIEAAMDLGANRRQVFRRIVLPLTMPGIITGIVLVFIPSLGAFITPDLLGGAKSAMIGTVIQNQFVQRNQPLGSALSVLLIVVVLTLLLIASRAARPRRGL